MKKQYRNTIGYPGLKVGRLKAPIAKYIGRNCADIYISHNHIRHIENKHQAELDLLGLDAIEYVRLIAQSFNQIRQGSDNSLLLVLYRETEKRHPIAAININYSMPEQIWEIKTAGARETSAVEKKELLWESCRHSR